MLEALANELKNINRISPVLLLGDAAKVFRENYGKNNNNVIYTCIPKETPFNENINVFDVCSFSSDTSILESHLPIIILAEDTTIKNDILSKVKYIIKYSNKSISKLTNAKEALELWKEENSDVALYNYCAYNSPELYYYKNKFNMNKYIDLFSSE